MSAIAICDKCGTREHAQFSSNPRHWQTINLPLPPPAKPYERGYFMLCPQCQASLLAWVTGPAEPTPGGEQQ